MADKLDKISTRSRQFDDIKDDIIRSLPDLAPNWTSHGIDEPGIAILEILAGASDALHFNLDKQAREAFLTTAIKPESISAIAQMLHYRPKRWIAAQGDIVLNVTEGEELSGLAIEVSGLKSVKIADGRTLTTLDSIIVPEGSVGQYTISAVEGVYKSYITTLSPENIFSILLPNENIAEQLFEVYIDSELWYDAIDHPLNTDIDNFYFVRKNSEGRYEISFRNSRGRVPAYGQRLEVKYLVTTGENFLAGEIQEGDAPVDLDGLFWSYTDFTNASTPETTQQTIDRAPAKNSTANRAVTLEDYKNLATQLPNVKSIYVQKHILGWNTVEIYVATRDGDAASVELLQTVKNFFEARNNLVVSIRTYSALFKLFNLSLTVRVRPGYNATGVLNQVTATLRDSLSYNKLNFSQSIRVSDIYATVEAVPGVDYSNISGLYWATDTLSVSNLVPRDSEHPKLFNLSVILE